MNKSQQAPQFQLPPPPPGMRWHRDGWKAEDLPQGYRPLTDGELIRAGDEVRNKHSDSFQFVKAALSVGHNAGGLFPNQLGRTTRPLVFTHEGKEWTYHRPGDLMPCDGEILVESLMRSLQPNTTVKATFVRWTEIILCDGTFSSSDIIGWRAKTTKTVELGSEDVPVEPVIRSKGTAAICSPLDDDKANYCLEAYEEAASHLEILAEDLEAGLEKNCVLQVAGIIRKTGRLAFGPDLCHDPDAQRANGKDHS